jgi:uncharacterized protein YjiK
MKRKFAQPIISLFLALLAYSSAAALNVSGVVWQDQNNNGTFNTGEGTNAGGPLYVNLVDPTGTIVSSSVINNNGSYTLTGLANHRVNFKLVLTNTPTNTYGNRLPGTYYSVSQTIGVGNSADQTGSIPGEIKLTTSTANVTEQNFRIKRQLALSCQDGTGYQVSAAAGERMSSLYSYNMASGARTLIATTPYNLNSLVYSVASDNMLWATVNGANKIVRLGSDGEAVEFTIANLPTTNFNVGAELSDGYMMVYASNINSFYVIDVDPARPSYLELVDPSNGFTRQTGPQYGITLDASNDANDLAYLASTKLSYGVSRAGSLVTVNAFTGSSSTSAVPITGLASGAYGSVFADDANKLYAFNNTSGTLYKIDIAANIAIETSTSIPSGNNDGASCASAVIECDNDIQPIAVNSSVCAGGTATFTVEPDGTGPFNFRWQQSTDGGTTWTDMQTAAFTGPDGTYSGAGTKSLTISPTSVAWNGHRYRSRVNSNLCITNSTASILTVYALPVTPTLLVSNDAPVCPATTYDLTKLVTSTTPAGSTLKFYSTATPDAATLVANPAAAAPGTYYAVYENSNCRGVTSELITIGNCMQSFTCQNGMAYQVAVANGETVSSLYSYNVSTGERALISPLTASVNSLIFSDVDNTLWAVKNSNLVRIAANGTLIEYPIPSLTHGTNVGSSLPGGYMLIYNENHPKFYVIDIDYNRVTYLKMVDPRNNFALQTGTDYGIALTNPLNVADLAYDTDKKLMFGIERSTGKIATLDPFTGVSSINSTAVSNLPLSQYGAIFTDPSGNLYAFDNVTGSFYQITHADNAAVLLSTSVPSSNNDGASCLTAKLVDQPFTCDEGIAYQTINSAGTASLYGYNVVSGVKTLIAPLPYSLNGLIYNSVDNMLWAYRTGTNKIIKIDREGATESYPIANLPSGFNSGAELPNGYMLLYSNSSGSDAYYYVVDINPSRATYLQLVDPTAGFVAQTGPQYGTAISSPIDISDIAFVSKDQLCYGIARNGQIATLNPFTGEAVVGAPVSGLPASGGYGAIFSDVSGRLYAFHNDSGSFYLVHPSTNTASLLSTGEPSGNNDGASCANTNLSNLPFDCEDGITYQVAAPAGNANSLLYAFNVAEGVRTLIAPLPYSVNGLIYNSSDNMLWGSSNNSIVRIDREGGTTMFAIANLPMELTHYNVGTELPNGYMMLYRHKQDIQQADYYYVIDLNPNRATYLQLVDPTAGFTLKAGPNYGTLVNSPAPFHITDIAFVSGSNLCYGVTPEGILASLDPLTGTVIFGATPVSGLPTGNHGSIVSDVTGRLYTFHNESGSYYRVNTVANFATLISTNTPSFNNDGASCSNVTIENLPFTCNDGITYQIAAASGDATSSLYALNVVTGVRTLIAPLPYLMNSLVYSSADNMLWAYINASNSIARIDSEGGVVAHSIANLPIGSNVGVELPNGYMMLYNSNNANYYVVDIDPSRATYLQLVDPTAGFVLKTGPDYGTAVTIPLDISDIAFVSSKQLAYGITVPGALASLDPFTGNVVVKDTPVAGLPTGGYGAVVTDSTGNFYAFHNATGGFYKIDVETNAASLIATFAPSGRNDGANCSTVTLCDITMSDPNPLAPTVCVNTQVTLSVTASSSSPLNYQWQVSTDNGISWNNISHDGETGVNGTYSGAGTAALLLTPITNVWNGNQYRVIVNSEMCSLISNVSTLKINTPQACGPLPVKLIRFHVTKEEIGLNGVVILDWATTEENNSDRFEIERSKDGNIWNVIGSEQSHGESNTLRGYDFTDNSPAQGNNYYRLKLIDKDGAFAYSRILNAEFGASVLTAYPNPVSERLFIKNSSKVQLVIVYNAVGLKMVEKQVVTSEGMDISQLDAGLYTVRIVLTDGTGSTQKVAVIR